MMPMFDSQNTKRGLHGAPEALAFLPYRRKKVLLKASQKSQLEISRWSSLVDQCGL